VWDDVIEYFKDRSFIYHQEFLEDIRAALQSPHAKVRRTAAWGVGMMAQHGGPVYVPFINRS
jgi:hypothetical protein